MQHKQPYEKDKQRKNSGTGRYSDNRYLAALPPHNEVFTTS